MTARALIPYADLDRAARKVAAEGVVITIRTPDGTVYTIAPATNAAQHDPFDVVEMKR